MGGRVVVVVLIVVVIVVGGVVGDAVEGHASMPKKIILPEIVPLTERFLIS